jgi:integrase
VPRTGIASRYLVHNTERGRGYGKLGAPMHPDRLSKEFTAAIDALTVELKLDWGDKEPPTFHEIRSLSKRLYDAQGGVDTVDLLGHADEKMGEVYADARGVGIQARGDHEGSRRRMSFGGDSDCPS